MIDVPLRHRNSSQGAMECGIIGPDAKSSGVLQCSGLKLPLFFKNIPEIGMRFDVIGNKLQSSPKSSERSFEVIHFAEDDGNIVNRLGIAQIDSDRRSKRNEGFIETALFLQSNA